MQQSDIDKLENDKLLTEIRLQKEKFEREKKEQEALEAAEIIPAPEGEQGSSTTNENPLPPAAETTPVATIAENAEAAPVVEAPVAPAE